MKSNKMRQLLERLPELASLATITKLVIVQTGCYRPFIKQCLQNSSNLSQDSQPSRPDQMEHIECSKKITSALKRALNWHRVARVHQRLVMAVYLGLIIKYKLLAHISSQSWPISNLQYLDCFILGRFRFVGRTNMIAGQVATVFLIWFLVFRVFNHTQDNKFYALEFLLNGHELIKRNELLANGRGAMDVRAKQRIRAKTANSIAYLRCPFDLNENEWILRPNRTRDSWHTLALYSKIILYTILLFIPSWFGLVTWSIAGSIQTNLGFEMSYPACVSWLRTMQTNPTAINNYSYIYMAPKVLAHEIGLDKIPAHIPFSAQDLIQGASPFSLLRISLDILENLIIYLEHFLLFISGFYVFFIHSMDVTLNAVGIKNRMLKLIEKLEAQRELACERKQRAQFYTRLIDELPWHEPGHNFKVLAHDTWQTEETENLQAILADHFNILTRGYNESISITIILMGMCWVHYTVLLCHWISTIRSRAVELEFMLAEAMVTIICVIILWSFVRVRSQNLQLYPLITRVMALDADSAKSTRRWATTLNYFHPRPCYCFTIAGSLEISSLLCLKLFFWILSVFCVLANFFYMYR